MLGLGLSLQKAASVYNAARVLVSSYIKRVTDAGGYIEGTECAVEKINELNQNRLLEKASWVLVPQGIEEDVVFAQKPTTGLGDLTFTRSSDGTRTNAQGVVERTPWNLLQFSEDFTVWNKQQVNVSSNVAANPLTGLVNADLLVPDTTNNAHRIFNNGTATTPSSNILSVYAKAAGYNYISLGNGGGLGGSGIIFNLSNGTVSGSVSGFSGTISPAGNGWYLCSLIQSQATNDYIATSRLVIIRDNSTNSTFTGDGTSGVLVANAQLVEGTEAKPYFMTTNRQDVPRLDYRNADGTLSSCPRLLLEPQRTNSIRNSSMVGAVAGSPGTLPTNWNLGTSGLTQTVVGIGTEDGLPYIDLRYNGTATASSFDINFDAVTQIAASNGQVWTASAYLKQVSNPSPVNSISYLIFEYTSAGAFLAAGSLTLSVTSSLERFPFTRTLNGGATVGAVRSFFRFNLTNGATYDFTIRIAAPQMELGAYATTWVPTTTAAVTRLADSASKTGVSSLIGQTEGTLFVEVSMSNWESPNRLFAVSDGTTNNRIVILQSTANRFRVLVSNNNVAQADFTGATLTNGNYKLALAYAENDFILYVNGALAGSDLSGTVPSCSDIYLGKSESPSPSQFLSNPIAQAALFPTRLTNAQLAELTTL